MSAYSIIKDPWYELLGKEADPDTAQVLIIPAPYQGSVSYGKGTARGPEALFQASQQVEQFEPELGFRPCRIGISGIPPLKIQKLKPAQAVKKVENAVRMALKKGKKPVMIGGEHSLSSGAIKATKEFYPDLSVLHLDAHADLRNEYHGTPYSHACIMRRVLEMDVPFVSVGIRSLSQEEWDLIQEKKLRVYFSHKLASISGWQELVARELSEKIYITLDIDVLDPSEIPGTGTPEPGGLNYRELLSLIKAIAHSKKQVVGMDLMELAPIKGEQISEFTSARILYQMIGWLWAK